MEKPGKVQTLSILILINGILNVLWGGGLFIAVVLGTFFVGLLCTPVLLLPMALGVVEIIHGINLISDPPKVAKPSRALAIFEMCGILFGNLISLVVGVIYLVFSNDGEVKGYFESLPIE